MTTLSKLAAATVLGVACGAWAGVSPAPVDVQAVHVGVDGDAAFVFASNQIDGANSLLTASPTSSTYVTASNNSSLPVKQSAGPTVVPLPAAAPAGLLLLGMIGLVSFVRRMRSRMTSPV